PHDLSTDLDVRASARGAEHPRQRRRLRRYRRGVPAPRALATREFEDRRLRRRASALTAGAGGVDRPAAPGAQEEIPLDSFQHGGWPRSGGPSKMPAEKRSGGNA